MFYGYFFFFVYSGQAAEVVAAKSTRGLEAGQELVMTEFLSYMAKRIKLEGSASGEVLRALRGPGPAGMASCLGIQGTWQAALNLKN
ncbi:hypothetical protein F5Y14DRAFT_446583 [Nemania sp. NC0429]|nr:hypothetical protein F5Y14DRAFT_446583 [Nemania sp. NC0429]